jgi:general secretion pathway protein B
MSFILDALRKSEHERQRSAAPGIANVPFGAPRKVLPVWAVALMVVLALAVLGLGGAYLRSEWSSGARQARSADTPVASPPNTPRAPAAERPPPTSDRSAQLSERSLARETPRSVAPQTQGSPRGTSTSPPSPTLAAQAPAEPADEPRFPRADQPRFPRAAEPVGRGGLVLPSAASLEAEGIPVPKLELQLVAFYDSPADRYVFINGAKYREGATLAEGPRVVSISTNGAVMAYLGREFMLTQ